MLKRVLVGVIFVPLLVVLILFAPKWLFTCVVAFITGCASWELLHATAKLPLRYYVYTTVTAALLPLAVRFGAHWIALLAFAMLIVLFVWAIHAYDSNHAIAYEDLFKAMFAGIIMPAFLSSLVALMAINGGRALVLFTIGLAFVTDAGAYFAGVLLGKHKGITRVSPNKSLEGYLGGLLIGAVYALVFALVLQHAMHYEVNYPFFLVSGLVGAFVTETGDLSFSLIKRETGVKDYGNLLPGHGGMMDRFDSMVFCAPLVLLIHTLSTLI